MSVPRISTSSGVVTGHTDNSVDVYLGIPYAQSPLKTGRFDPPVPFETPEKQVDGTLYGTVLPQISIGFDREAPETKDDDEWLTLNVFTPHRDSDAGSMPVIVWVHGGSFISGTPASPTYDAVSLASRGAVVVTITYRLGVEGFLHVPGHPDNRAVLDIIAALRWVHSNCNEFGGDPSRITLAGQSAGALLALIAGVSKESQGLVERLVLQSPPALLASRELAEDVFEQVDAAHHKKYGGGIVEASPEAAADHLAKLGPELVATNDRDWKLIGASGIPLAPVVDGQVVSQSPYSAFATSQLPTLISHTTGEYRLFLELGGILDAVPDKTADGLVALSGVNPSGYSEAMSSSEVAEAAMTDRVFSAAAIDLLRARPVAGGETYGVVFDTAPAEGIGAAHAIDVCYLFDSLDVGLGKLMFPHPSVIDRQMGEMVRRLFVDFVNDRCELAAWDGKRVTLIADLGDRWSVETENPLLERYDAVFGEDLRGGSWIVGAAG